nr:MerR family DNA-binding protein [Nitrosomonas nitrosa]
MEYLTTGKLAKASGVKLETVRFYERQGLLPKPARTSAGYRCFSPVAVQRIQFIKRAQVLGFTLTEIKELLALSSAAGVSCGTVRESANAKIKDIEDRIRSLQSMRRALGRLARTCSGEGPISKCPILESLAHPKEEP